MRCDQIGVEKTKDQFTEFLNGVHPGQFFHIKRYKAQNDDGVVSDDPDSLSEVSDYFCRFGIKYDNFRRRDAAVLRSILSGERREIFGVVQGSQILAERLPSILMRPDQIAALSEDKRAELVDVTISYDMPVGDASVAVKKVGIVNLMDVFTFGNRKSKDRIPVTISYRLSSDHPLVVAAIGAPDQEDTLLQGIENPRPSHTDYTNEARSCFSREKDGVVKWYIRDVAVVSRIVIRQGVHKFKAKSPLVAVKDTIEEAVLLRSKYRQFILNEGNFSSITIEGQAILVDGISEGVYFALPELIKEMAEVEA